MTFCERDDSLGKHHDSTEGLRRSSFAVTQQSYSPQSYKRYTYRPSKPAYQAALVGEFMSKEALTT